MGQVNAHLSLKSGGGKKKKSSLHTLSSAKPLAISAPFNFVNYGTKVDSCCRYQDRRRTDKVAEYFNIKALLDASPKPQSIFTKPAAFIRRSTLLSAVPEEDSPIDANYSVDSTHNAVFNLSSTTVDSISFTMLSLGPKNFLTVYVGPKKKRVKVDVASRDTCESILDQLNQSSSTLFYTLFTQEKRSNLIRSKSGKTTWLRLKQRSITNARLPDDINDSKWVKIAEVPIGKDDLMWRWITLQRQREEISRVSLDLLSNSRNVRHRFIIKTDLPRLKTEKKLPPLPLEMCQSMVASIKLQSTRIMHSVKLTRMMTRAKRCRRIAVDLFWPSASYGECNKMMMLIMPTTTFAKFYATWNQRCAFKFPHLQEWMIVWLTDGGECLRQHHSCDVTVDQTESVLGWLDSSPSVKAVCYMTC
jgi:hypothetical protein